MKILYIVNTAFPQRPYHDVSVRYRCFNPAAELARRGHRSLVITQAAFERAPAYNFDIYVFHRPACTKLLPELLSRLKRNSLIIADYDDFSFHVSATNYLPGALRNRFLCNDLRGHMGAQGAIGPMFDCFTLSSSPLADKVKELFNAKKAILLHNAMPRNARALCALARAGNPWPGRKFLFGYFPGSKSHSRDLSMILELVMKKIRTLNARMLVTGPEFSGAESSVDCGCVEWKGQIPFLLMPDHMAQCRFILAPLENTPFTRCKSGIKFFEAALCGCPVLATPIPDIDRFNTHMLLKCDTPDKWQENLDRLLELDFDFENSLARLEEEVALEKQMDLFEKAFII